MAGRSAAGALVAADPASLLVTPEAVADPVLRIVLDRARSGSRPGSRSDPHRVCLAVEGGGMRGAVSAGMCVVRSGSPAATVRRTAPSCFGRRDPGPGPPGRVREIAPATGRAVVAGVVGGVVIVEFALSLHGEKPQDA